LLNCTFDVYLENEHLAYTLRHDVATEGASGATVRIFPTEPRAGSPVAHSLDDPFYAEYRELDLGR